MRKKRSALAAALALALALTAVFWLAGWYLNELYAQIPPAEETLAEMLDDIAGEAGRGGVSALEHFAFERYDGLLWDDVGANVNAVLLDRNGNVLCQTGSLATGGQAHVRLALSRYARWVSLEAEHPDAHTTIARGVFGRLGVLLDAGGNILSRFIAVQDDAADEDGGELRYLGGIGLSRYQEMFPELNEDAYLLITGGITQQTAASLGAKAFEEAEAYVTWEDAQLAQTDDVRARIVALGDGTGRVLAVFYPDTEAMRANESIATRYYAWSVQAVTAALICFGIFWLLLAVWVFRDARRRDFLPAMWGLLTLIGGVVAYLVYMLVRARGPAAKRCARCGTALRADFAFCPACGERARRRCPGCGRAAAEEWKVCPFCGAALETPAQAEQETLAGAEET